MTKGELISACIKLMFDNGNNQIDTTIVSTNETYKDRTSNIIESINRAFIRLTQLNKLPYGLLNINYDSANTKPLTQYDLNALTDNKILKYHTIYNYNEDNGIINGNIGVQVLNSNVILLPSLLSNEKYIIKYLKLPIKLNYTDSDNLVIDAPDYIVSIIPYFVKADLYEEDNPNLSVLARNTFETYVNSIPTQDEGDKRIIRDVYEGW